MVHGPELASLAELDAEAFAKWLRDAYKQSSFKSITELANAVNSNKATLSRLMSAAPQTLTGKPSKPRDSLVIALAEALNADVNEGLYYAGHVVFGRPNLPPRNYEELLRALESLGIEISWAELDLENATEQDFADLFERIKFDTEFSVRRKQR